MLRVKLFPLVIIAIGVCPASAQRTDAEKPPTIERSERLFERFDETARNLDIEPRDGEPYRWNEAPLFRFSTEGRNFGSVYVWRDRDDRLAVVGTIGSIPINDSDVEFVELHLLRPTPIIPLTIGDPPAKRWSPDVEDLQMKTLSSAPAVADSEALRLVQMRSIGRRFRAEMIHRGQTNRLRFLPQPLFRYSDSTRRFDGGLFAFVWDNGTDPEILLRIEVVTEDGEPVWKYQPVRFTWRHVKLYRQDDKPVWEAEEFVQRDQRQQVTPYLTGLTTAIP